MPKSIVELRSINDLIEAGNLVIACGGGGVPTVRTDHGLTGVPAVIDKDRSSALLADNLAADQLIILAAVDEAFVNYGKPNQQALRAQDVQEARRYIEEGQFAEGSMLPKIEACLSFVGETNRRSALITSLNHLDDALAGKVGTLISKTRMPER